MNVTALLDGPLHFFFDSDPDFWESSPRIIEHIYKEYDVIHISLDEDPLRFRVSNELPSPGATLLDPLDLVEMLEDHLVRASRIALLLFWSRAPEIDMLKRFSRLNDLVQRVRSARGEWSDGIKTIIWVGTLPTRGERA